MSDAPRIPDSVTDDQLSREVKDELGSLSADRASIVGRYMVAAELATDPEQAYRYAQAARKMATRIGVVREVSASPPTGPDAGRRPCPNCRPAAG